MQCRKGVALAVSMEIQAPLQIFSAMHITKAYHVPLQEKEEKAVSNWHIRNDLLGPCVMVGRERGGGWK